MPKRVDAAAQRAVIRDAARRAFGSRGVAGTGLSHVAREAGMGRSSLYHYYPDKQRLVRELALDLVRQEARLFATALQDPGSPLERIERLAQGLPRVVTEWSRLGTMIFDLWSRDASLFRPFFRQMRGDLASLIRQGQDHCEIDTALDAELTAAVVIGAIDGLVLQHLIDPDAFTDLSALSNTIASIFLRALR